MGEILTINPSRIESVVLHRAASVVKRGGVLLYPTDTIYGFGCSALSDRAIRRVYKIKRRPEQNPAIVLVDSQAMLRNLVAEVPPIARRLMKEFWPGPLTLVFRASRVFHPFMLGTNQTIGIRIPDNAFCRKLVHASQLPLISTSANVSGEPPHSKIVDLIKQFRRSVDIVIDAGTLIPSKPSTVVDVTASKPVIIREGAISTNAVMHVIQSSA